MAFSSRVDVDDVLVKLRNLESKNLDGADRGDCDEHDQQGVLDEGLPSFVAGRTEQPRQTLELALHRDLLSTTTNRSRLSETLIGRPALAIC
jgi:hypothetical protein